MQEDNNQGMSEWTGWIGFASIVMMFEGILQFIYGLAALFNQSWYVATTSGVYLFDLGTWGWISIVLGLLLFVSGLMLARGSMFGRAAGVVFVVVGILSNLALIVVAPVWSIIALVLYAFSFYAILAHGGEMQASRS